MKNIINPLSPTENIEPIQTVLRALAGQDNCDGEPYDQIQIAADYIDTVETEIAALRAELAEKETLLIHHEQYEEALEVKLSNTEADNAELRNRLKPVMMKEKYERN